LFRKGVSKRVVYRMADVLRNVGDEKELLDCLVDWVFKDSESSEELPKLRKVVKQILEISGIDTTSQILQICSFMARGGAHE